MVGKKEHPIFSNVHSEPSLEDKKDVKLLGLDENSATMYKILSERIRKLEEKSDDHTSQFRNFGMRVMAVENDVEELDEVVDRDGVVDLINKTVPLAKIDRYSSQLKKLERKVKSIEIDVDILHAEELETSESSDSEIEILEVSNRPKKKFRRKVISDNKPKSSKHAKRPATAQSD